jgi:hypothetical protein
MASTGAAAAPLSASSICFKLRAARDLRCCREAAGRDAVNCFKTIVLVLSLFDENHNQLPFSSADCAPDGPVTA